MARTEDLLETLVDDFEVLAPFKARPAVFEARELIRRLRGQPLTGAIPLADIADERIAHAWAEDLITYFRTFL